MKIEISHGELLDKISILEIKTIKIDDEDKFANVKKEHEALYPYFLMLLELHGHLLKKEYDELLKVNIDLWNIEDDIRDCERDRDFSQKFINLARSVYVTNDKRAFIKKRINQLTNSNLTEEKSYKEY
jgi:hypothetical protein|tara:strand:+ start:14468 stop:14851 length:384 start_codon:yes stop_codon:yes gene_type:complete